MSTAQEKTAEIITRQQKEQALALRHQAMLLQPFAPSDQFNREQNLQAMQLIAQFDSVAMVELGKRLIWHKGNVKHGEFTEDLDRIGLHHRTAGRYMNVARKLGGLKTDTVSVLSFARLYALAEETTEAEIKLLSDGQPVAGLTLDQFDDLTVDELRKRLRDKTKREKTLEKRLEDGRRQLDAAQDQIDELRGQDLPADLEACLTGLIKWEQSVYGSLRQVKHLQPERWNRSAASLISALGRIEDIIAAESGRWIKIQIKLSEAEGDAE